MVHRDTKVDSLGSVEAERWTSVLNVLPLCLPFRIPDGTSALFVSGLCRWPGCDAVTKDFPSFLK